VARGDAMRGALTACAALAATPVVVDAVRSGSSSTVAVQRVDGGESHDMSRNDYGY
jgi:hypothetical protein